MSFLKNFLGKSEKEVESKNQQKQTIFDLFNIDLTNIPDATFFLNKIEKDTKGIEKLLFKRKLEYEECGLFNKIKIILHSEENYNVVLESDINFNFPKLEELINNIYSIYGKDDKKYGRFTSSERNEITNHYWVGRNYFEERKFPNKPMICLYESDDRIYLTVFNPKNIELQSDGFALSTKYKPKGISLLEKLKELDIDFSNNDKEGTTLEFTLEEEINGITDKVFNSLDNQFFTSSIFINYVNGNKELFLSKKDTIEKDFKTLLDKTGNLLGPDLDGRNKFTIDDLNIIRGAIQKDDEVYGIRHWIDLHSGYDIVITFDEDEKDIYLRIYKSMSFS